MNKIIIDLENKPNKDDVIVFDGNHYYCVSIQKFMKPLEEKMAEIKNEMETIKEDNKKLKQAVNEKLKQYHDVLKIISKGE